MFNFYKCTCTSKIITEFTQYQPIPYNLQPVQQISSLLSDLEIEDFTAFDKWLAEQGAQIDNSE